jgi:hypothetical protein
MIYSLAAPAAKFQQAVEKSEVVLPSIKLKT